MLPPDGTKEWCTNVRLLLQSVRDVGLAILDWADAKTVHAHERAEAIRTALDQTVGSVPFLSGFLTDVFRSTVDLAEATLAGLRWLMCALRNGTIRSTKCDVMTYSGLMAFKFAWEGLKQVRFGVSIFVSVTVQLPSEIPLIDNMIHYLINIACPNEIPSPAEAREAFLTGDLPEDMYKCWLGAHGVNSDTAEFVLRARREKLTTREVIEWARRRGHDDTTTAQELRAIGWIDSDEAMAVVALYDEIPTIADHLHWLQRNVFDTDYVRDFELMEGFEDRFWKKFGTDLRIKGMKKEYAELHYAAHWINPAPEQMKRMLWRLRPEKYDKDLAFNIDDYERVLREQDVGAFFRRRWKEIAYEVPAISYIKEWYRQGLINKDELAGYHRDLGYKPKDAELFADIDDLQKRRMRASQSRGWTMSAVASAWGMRLISANRVYELSAGLGYTRQEADAMMEVADVSIQRQLVSRTHQQALRSTMQSVLGSVDIGIMTVDQSTSALQSLGMPQSYAGAISLARAGAAQAKQTKEAINAIKRGRLSGEFDEGYARSSLAALGVAPQAIDRYLSLWALQWTAARKRRTARDLINDVAYGLMTRDEAMVRLSNLGYADPDRMLFLADAQRKVSDIEAKRLAATEKAGRAQELALAKAARDAGKAKKEIVKQLVKAAPVAKLQKWATLGIIGKDTFTARLRLYGYPDASITALYEEACKAKGAACEDVTKEAETKPIASAGTTVSPNGE